MYLNIIFGVESTGAYCTFLLAKALVPQLYFQSLKHWFQNSICGVGGTGAYCTCLLAGALVPCPYKVFGCKSSPISCNAR